MFIRNAIQVCKKVSNEALTKKIMNRTIPIVLRQRGISSGESKLKMAFSASEVRKSFLDFFCKENGHFHVPSSPVFSLNDPTLAFVNAGMNQFKNVFLGLLTPVATKVANSQKCIRIGGKHNDLVLIGRDGTHHSFFEMLGNWSFGDYFKKEACKLSWDLLTKVYLIPPERLYVTYFKGEEALGLDPDLEVREIWRELGVKESHILGFGMKQNFWEMGKIGPCGVCTEIHYDHVPERKESGNLVNSNDNTVSELWNIVFTQYQRTEDGHLKSLNKHFVDTGMGFERLLAILQGKKSNYETDLFLPLFEVIKNHSRHGGYTGKYGLEDDVDYGYRVLADHGRMIAFALSDGMIPNHQNKVRTIIRKSLTICEKTFKSDEKLLVKVVNRVADIFSDAYPQILQNLSKIQYLIEEENEVIKNLQKNAVKVWSNIKETYPGIEISDIMESPGILEGLKFIKRHMEKTGSNCISPENAWILFDAFGIPPKTTEKLASTLGLNFDMTLFNNYQDNCKKNKKKVLEEKLFERVSKTIEPDILSHLKDFKPSKDYFKHDYWVNDVGNYVFPRQSTTVEAIVWGSHLVSTLTPKMLLMEKDRKVGLVLDRTQFCCSERNRQSDAGTLFIENEIVFNVENIVKVKGLTVHYGTFETFPSDSELSVNNVGVLTLNEKMRLKMMRNHTALNLLKAAIREKIKISGEKYSMVGPDQFFLTVMSYKDKLHLKDFEEIEKFVNLIIKQDVAVLRRPLSHCEFYELKDVVYFPGTDLIESELPVFEINSSFTLIREHCTGTHVLSTSHIKDFLITKYYKTGYCVYNVAGITGEEAAAVRLADAKIWQNWTDLKSKFLKNEEDNSEIIKFKKYVTDSSGFSHVVRHKILAEIKVLNKKNTSVSSRQSKV